MKNNILRFIKKLCICLADLVLPRRCIVCDEKLGLDEKHLCANCDSDMPLTRFWQLKHNRMADKFNEVIQKKLEEEWDRNGRVSGPHERYAYAAALFFFNDDADYKRIPYCIKYEGGLRVGKYFGLWLGRVLASSEWFQDIDTIIPVPLHWLRRWKRGYNQAEVIASGISAALGAPIRTDILRRTKHTRTQINLNIQQKASNVADAFSASSHQTRPTNADETNCSPIDSYRHVLLVDDVFTTGSTLTACFFALRSALPPGVRISVATLGFVGRA